MSGLIRDLPRKNVESIAYGGEQNRKKLQNFIGFVSWNHVPLMQDLAARAKKDCQNMKFAADAVGITIKSCR